MKPWYTSKTLWVNILTLVAAVSGAFGLDLGLDTETQASIVAGILAVANIILRLVTKDGVSVGKPPVAVLALTLVLPALVACAGSVQTKATTSVAIACDTYGALLDQAAGLRKAGKLSAGQIETIDRLNRAVDVPCMPGSPIDPAAAVGVVQSAIATVKEIVK